MAIGLQNKRAGLLSFKRQKFYKAKLTNCRLLRIRPQFIF